MAKRKTAKKNSKSFEETLWDSANKLRGSVEPAEYKHVVLSLIFLKFASDKFEERRQEIIDEGQEKFADMVEFYTMKKRLLSGRGLALVVYPGERKTGRSGAQDRHGSAHDREEQQVAGRGAAGQLLLTARP